MKTTLTLKTAGTRQLANLKAQLAVEALSLEREVKLTISNSTPRGKTYRTGRISKTATKQNSALRLRSYKTASGKKRVIVGAKFHRASAKGQPPAIRTGGLLNSIKAEKRGQLSWRVIVSKRYGVPLDAKTGLDRPFFKTTVEKFRPGYLGRMRAALNK